MRVRQKLFGTALPGFGLALGLTVLYVSLIVLLPTAAAVAKSSGLGWERFWASVSTPRALAAYRLSFGAALLAAGINLGLGSLAAWVLVRYRFPGRRWLDALVDLPFALPTAVAGIALTVIYGPHGWLGQPLAALGIRAAYTRLGVVIALTFIGLPFVVRAVQPVLAELDPEWEEAAASLGAGRWQTFRRVLLPALRPAAMTGFAMAFARGVGEYGSVIFIAGNMPMRTEIAPLLIVIQLQEFNDAQATAIAMTMLAAALVMLLAIQWLQQRSQR